MVQIVEEFVARLAKNNLQKLSEEDDNGCKHGTDNEELEYVVAKHVDHKENHTNLSVPWMTSTSKTGHVCDILEHLECTEQGTIHPSSSLLQQSGQVGWRISEGLSIRHITEVVSLTFFNVDLQTHNSIFGKILICFSAGRILLAGHILEESIERLTFDGVPSEHRVSTRQHTTEAKESFSTLVRGVTKFILVELGSLNKVRFICTVLLSLGEVDLNLTGASTAVIVVLHILVQLDDGLGIGTCTNIEEHTELGLEELADSLEEPFM